MENEVKKQKNSNVILIVFMTLLIVGLIVFILYDKNIIFGGNSNEGGSNNTDNPNQDVITKRDLDINSSEVKKVMSSFDELKISDSSLYVSDVYSSETITNEDLVSVAINLFVQSNNYVMPTCEYEGDLPKDVSLDMLNDALSKYISNKTITMDNIKSLRKVDYDSYYNTQYDVGHFEIALNENDLKFFADCGGYVRDDFVDRKIVSAYEEGEYVYVFEKQAFGVIHIMDEPIKTDYYKEYSRINKIETVLENNKPNWNQYNTYKYTFKKDNNNYYFIKLELDK